MSPNSNTPLDLASYTQTAHAAWSAFMRSRLETPHTQNVFGSALEQQSMIEVEHGMLRHYTAIAGQRLNALRPAGRLPGELLAMIFAYAQAPSSFPNEFSDGWMPRRFLVDSVSPGDKPVIGGKKNITKSVRYDIGWIGLTHVCSAWRTAALHNNNLWQSITCFALPVRSVSEIVARAGSLPLRIKAHERLGDEIETVALDTWLSGPLLRRAEVLNLTTYSEARLNEWAPYLLYSPRSLRELSISSFDLASIPEDIFASQHPPNLRSLSLSNCLLEWSSPLLSANLRHLTLKTPWEECDADSSSWFPSKSDFRNMLSSMSALESLTLEEIFPVSDIDDPPSEAGYAFPSNFRSLRVRCQSVFYLLHDVSHYRDFFARCSLPNMAVLVADVTMIDDIMAEDEEETILGSYLAPLTKTHMIAPQSTTELMLGRKGIGLRYEVENVSSPWALAQSSSEQADRLLRDDLSLPADVVDENWAPVPDQWASGSMGGGRLWVCNWIDVSKYVNLLPLPTIDIVSLVPNVMSLFTTAEAWLSAFDVAHRVERLSASYLRCIHLFSALTRTSNGTGEPSLFPRLSTLVFVAEIYILDEHQALRTAVDIYLKDVLLVRKEAGTPIRHIYVDKSLSSWSIWAEVDGGTVVSFFE